MRGMFDLKRRSMGFWSRGWSFFLGLFCGKNRFGSDR